MLERHQIPEVHRLVTLGLESVPTLHVTPDEGVEVVWQKGTTALKEVVSEREVSDRNSTQMEQ